MKQFSRDEIIAWIKSYIKSARKSEEFKGEGPSTTFLGGIWVSGENALDIYKGKRIYEYYSNDSKNRTFGVLNSWEKALNRRGWYSEWNDVGTIMIWRIRE